jgi:hypothetical protein
MNDARPGNLAFFDVESEALRVAFPGPPGVGTGSEAPPSPWGDEECPGPPGAAFRPHGIDLDRRSDDRLQLLAVNHGGRESVEFFEVTGGGRGIEWRGCAIPPEGALFNDVVSLPDGGFLVTHMMETDAQFWAMLRSAFGLDTGFVYEWQPGQGYRVVAGTDGAMPNGIEISADGNELFMGLYGGGEVRRISRQTGEILARVELVRPDNLVWGRDGRLLVASHLGGIRDQMACLRLTEGACPMSFEIVALDPVTLERETIFANEGAPMGAGTVAIDLGDELVIGSFAGDRIIKARPGPL